MSRLFQVEAPDFQILQACPRPVSIDTRDLSHINLDPPPHSLSVNLKGRYKHA